MSIGTSRRASNPKGESLNIILGLNGAMRRGGLVALSGLVVLLLLSSGAAAQESGEPLTDTINEVGYCTNPEENSGAASYDITYEFNVKEVLSVNVLLTWSDDEGSSSNTDVLGLRVRDDMGATANEAGSGGSVQMTFAGDELGINWTVTVECVEAGMTPFGPLGLRGYTDPGNTWDLEFTYTYIEVEKAPTGPQIPPEIQELYTNPIFWTHVAFMIASTYMFGLVGLLAGIALVTRKRWGEDASRWKRALATNRPFRALASHTWMVFFIAAVPLGIYVAGKAYGWENSWTSLPAVWNPWFYDIKNADHVSLIVIVLWAIPLWLNRWQLVERHPHAWLFGRFRRVRQLADNAPEPVVTDREMAIIYFIMGVFVFLVFMVQSHGN